METLMQYINYEKAMLLAEKFGGVALKWLPNLILALLTLMIGFWAVGKAMRLIDKGLELRGVEQTLRSFMQSFVSVALKLFVAITALTFLGVKTTSLIAIMGAAGLAVGLALQGSLSNFAGGVLILFFKPFRVGDYIIAQGHEGIVDSIMIFNTVLKTPSKETIILPNGDLANGAIRNFSHEKQRRLDLTFGIGYNDDIDEARRLIQHVIAQDKRILNSPEPEIYVSGHGDSAVNILTRVWTSVENYWPVNFYLWEEVKKTFDKNGISIPYPQRDMHVYRYDANDS